jgi:hypothetical protein
VSAWTISDVRLILAASKFLMHRGRGNSTPIDRLSTPPERVAWKGLMDYPFDEDVPAQPSRKSTGVIAQAVPLALPNVEQRACWQPRLRSALPVRIEPRRRSAGHVHDVVRRLSPCLALVAGQLAAGADHGSLGASSAPVPPASTLHHLCRNGQSVDHICKRALIVC